jgi:mercuric ion binding protein
MALYLEVPFTQAYVINSKNTTHMKSILLALIMITISTLSFSQNKNAKASIEVDGVCMMCKTRIEKASLKTKGVKSAVWNVRTHELKLIFDENKTALDTIQKNIAAVGHDTKTLKATDDAYNSVHPCCKYREDEVVEEHK